MTPLLIGDYGIRLLYLPQSLLTDTKLNPSSPFLPETPLNGTTRINIPYLRRIEDPATPLSPSLDPLLVLYVFGSFPPSKSVAVARFKVSEFLGRRRSVGCS